MAGEVDKDERTTFLEDEKNRGVLTKRDQVRWWSENESSRGPNFGASFY
jgi:hypothetical protein